MQNKLSNNVCDKRQRPTEGLDPSLKTECIIAQDIADLVEGLVGPKEVALSIRELSTRIQREEIAFKVAEANCQ